MYGFVLKRRDFRESDQLVTFYTWEKGRVEALARGVKKIISKNSAFLESVFLLELDVVPGKDISVLTKAVPFFCYKNIIKDLDKMIILQAAFSWVSSLTSVGEREPKIFILIKSWLEFLDKTDSVSSALAYGFLGNLIVALGFAPDLDSCSICGDKNNLSGFYPAGGGVVCRKCLLIKKEESAKIYPIRAVDLQSLQNLFSKNWQSIMEHNTEIANRLLFLYAQYHGERKLAKLKLI